MSHCEYQLSLPARTETDDDPAVAALLGKAKAGIGMIPNMYANMANAPGLLDTYLSGYAAFRSERLFAKLFLVKLWIGACRVSRWSSLD